MKRRDSDFGNLPAAAAGSGKHFISARPRNAGCSHPESATYGYEAGFWHTATNYRLANLSLPLQQPHTRLFLILRNATPAFSALWAAYAAFEEDLKGTISAGKLADFTVLSADIMKIAELEILQTKNVMTIIGGQVVYDAVAH